MTTFINSFRVKAAILVVAGLMTTQHASAGEFDHARGKQGTFQTSSQFSKVIRNQSKVIAAPNGNTGINGTGLPQRGQNSRVIAAPNGNTGITGAGLPAGSVAGQAHGEFKGPMKARRLPAASPTDNKAVIVTAPTTGVRGLTSNATALKKSHTPGGWITRTAVPVFRARTASRLEVDAQNIEFGRQQLELERQQRELERQQLSALLRKLEQDASDYANEQAKLRDPWKND